MSGLKWVDRYESKLCSKELLLVEDVVASLSEAKAVLLLIGTNSIPIVPAERVIDDVKEIVSLIRRDYPHLNDPDGISIGLTFPCLKITRRYLTERSMLENIVSFNEQLKSLSMRMRFNVVDFHLTVENLARDRIHIHHAFQNRNRNTIMDHFEHLAVMPVNSAAILITTSYAESGRTVVVDERPSQSSNGSRDALNRRNEESYCYRRRRLSLSFLCLLFFFVFVFISSFLFIHF